jgi:thiamine-phosphate pyrophosphorylase
VKMPLGLYVVTPGWVSTERLLLAVESALMGGASVVQYRAKALDDALRLEQAQALGLLCRRFNAPFIVNDSLSLALAVDADGVHLGFDDGKLGAARNALGANKLLGASCYGDLELANHAIVEGADYVAFGAAFASPSKPMAATVKAGLFAQATATLRVPVVAIGGINLLNAPSLRAEGVQHLAVISALFEARHIERQARRFAALFA